MNGSAGPGAGAGSGTGAGSGSGSGTGSAAGVGAARAAGTETDRLAVLTGGLLDDYHAKTTHGVLRYGTREVVCVVD
ncbi:MAG: hypothetical protein P8Z68_03395, partial [Kineosporiaceae bacterium]